MLSDIAGILDSKCHQGGAELRGEEPARSEQGACRRAPRLAACWVAYIGDPAGDGRRGIDERDRPGGESLKAVQQEGIMRAGKHDRIGPALPIIAEAGRELSCNEAIRDW